MISESKLLSLTAGIYDAALEPTRWPHVLEQLAEALQGRLTAIFVHDFRSLDGTTVWTVRGDPEYLRRYNEHYHAKNIYVTHRPENITVGRVLTSEELCPERDVLRSEYYSDWLRPQDLFWTTGGALLEEDSVTAIFTSLRPHRAPPFGPDQVGVQQVLFPHFQRALQLQRRLRGLEDVRDAACAALDRLPIGLLLFDEDGRELTVNAAARQILEDGDGLTLRADGFHAAVAAETAALRASVRGAAVAAAGHGLSAGAALRLSRPSSKRPLALLVVPLPRGRLGLGFRTAAVAVFVSDPERNYVVPLERLCRLYGLTAAESRLLAALMDGGTPDQAAQRFDVSVKTVRAQVKRIFEKTGTSRQAELLRLVLGSPVMVDQE